MSDSNKRVQRVNTRDLLIGEYKGFFYDLYGEKSISMSFNLQRDEDSEDEAACSFKGEGTFSSTMHTDPHTLSVKLQILEDSINKEDSSHLLKFRIEWTQQDWGESDSGYAIQIAFNDHIIDDNDSEITLQGKSYYSGFDHGEIPKTTQQLKEWVEETEVEPGAFWFTSANDVPPERLLADNLDNSAEGLEEEEIEE